MMDFVPGDNVFAASGHRPADREDQPTLKRDLQQSQHPTTETVIRQVTYSRKTDGIIGLAGIGVFVGLNPRRNAERIDVKLRSIRNRLYRHSLFLSVIVRS